MKHKSQLIKAQIHNLGYCSEGLGKVIEGDQKDITVFIDNTTIGDVVEAETFSHKKNYLKAKLTKVLEEGSTRIDPKCPLSKVCGGCQWLHVHYQTQLKVKSEIITHELTKTINLDPGIIRDIIPNPELYNYRAKVQFPLGITAKSKRLLIGYYQPKTHDIVNIKYCPVQPEIFDKIIAEFRDIYNKFLLTIYNESEQKGYLRHLLLRKSYSNDDILLTIVVNSNSSDPKLKEIATLLVKKFPQIKGVTVNFNKTGTNVILGKKSETIYGYSFIIERLEDKSYQISDRTFFQINPVVAKLMFEKVKEIIQSKNKHNKLIDIYAGVSALSIYLSDLFEEIIAIENELSSYQNALESYKLNKITNIKYLNQDALQALKSIENLNTFDWIILDPPRSGCEKEVLETLHKSGCDNILYISCNPTTLARDLKILGENGYKVELVQPFDMFSHTYHVETITHLVKNG